MSQKPDYYAVLGLDRNADDETIKKAYTRLSFQCHPDRQHGKPDSERKAAEEKFKQGTEAYEVLKDPLKRSTYDKFGHDGLANMTSAGPASTVPRPMRKSEPITEEGVFDFFDKRREQSERKGPSTPVSAVEREDAREAHRRRREERLGINRSSTPTAPVTPATRPADEFTQVAQKVGEAAGRLREAGSARVPLDVLQKFRENLQDFIGVVDDAIAQAKKDQGFKP